jgi:hypothetical protein
MEIIKNKQVEVDKLAKLYDESVEIRQKYKLQLQQQLEQFDSDSKRL